MPLGLIEELLSQGHFRRISSRAVENYRCLIGCKQSLICQNGTACYEVLSRHMGRFALRLWHNQIASGRTVEVADIASQSGPPLIAYEVVSKADFGVAADETRDELGAGLQLDLVDACGINGIEDPAWIPDRMSQCDIILVAISFTETIDYHLKLPEGLSVLIEEDELKMEYSR